LSQIDHFTMDGPDLPAGGNQLSSHRAKKEKAQKKLIKHDWNFDSDKVLDDELVACCVWEYARESNSICGAVEIAKTAYANQGIARPESEEREAFRSAADKAFGLLHSTGFDNSFWVGLPFPEPWQTVGKSERKKWAHFCPKIPTPVKFPPFQVTGDLFIASVLHGEAAKAHEARQAIYLRLSQIDSGVANLPRDAPQVGAGRRRTAGRATSGADNRKILGVHWYLLTADLRRETPASYQLLRKQFLFYGDRPANPGV
jgi:hypothetical protein